MKTKPSAPKRDSTGLACTVGMALLILLAWATLPPSSATDSSPGTLVTEAVSLH